MIGPFKKKNQDAPKVAGKAVDFNKVKTAPATGSNGIVAESVMKSGNMASMGLSKEEQVALLEKRNEIPVQTKILKYSSIALFAFMLGSVLFLAADLDTKNGYFGLLGLADNTGSTYERVSRENTEKSQELQAIEGQIRKLKKRMADQIFGNHVDATEEILDTQKTWFTKNEEVTVVDEDTGAETTESQIDYGYIDMIGYLIDYFEDRNFKTSYFKEKEESLITSSGSRSRSTGLSSSGTLLMSNEMELRSFSVNDTNANLNIDASDIYGKIFTLGGEFVDIVNSTPMFKNGALRSFQRQELDTGDAGMNVSLRLELQNDEFDDADPADAKFKYLENWLDANGLLPSE